MTMAETSWRRGLHPKAVEAVEQALAADEAVRLVIHGLSSQAIIATDRRALVFKKGFLAGASFGSELTSWSYQNLVGVQIHTGMLSGAVVLQWPGQSGARTSTRILPLDVGTRPEIILSRVDLPAPFGPSRPVTPGPTPNVTSETATTSPSHLET